MYDSKNHSSCVKVTILDAVWFCLSISLHIYFLIFNYIYDHLSYVTDSRVLIISGRLTLWGGFLLAIIAIVLDMWNRKTIWNIVVQLYEFDVEVFLKKKIH